MSVGSWRRSLTAAAAAIAIVATGAPVAAAPTAVPEPHEDPFYQPPVGYETKSPGTLLRTREVSVPAPVQVKAWQTLTRSTDAKGRPIAVVSTLMVPVTAYPSGKRPLVSYQPATDSLGDQCNPSYTLRTATEKELALMALALGNGWAVVATDYQGPRNAYGPGLLEGRAVLDGIRAVEKLPATGLSGVGTPVGLWGYSGGALASGWAAELHPSYAPELNIVGVASGGTPSNLRASVPLMDGTAFAGLLIGASVGISREYTEVLTLMNDAGRAMIQRVGDMCVAELAVAMAFRRLNEFTTVREPFDHPIVASILKENEMGRNGPRAPVYLYHSIFDELIPFTTALSLRTKWCAKGTKVTLYADPLSEHSSLAVTGAPSAVAYLGARFAGINPPSC